MFEVPEINQNHSTSKKEKRKKIKNIFLHIGKIYHKVECGSTTELL